MTKTILLLALSLCSCYTYTQISFNDYCIDYNASDVSSGFYSYQGSNYIRSGCINIQDPNGHNFSSDSNYFFKAEKHIDIKDVTTINPMSSGAVDLRIEKNTFDVALMRPNSMDNILMEELVEIGIEYPENSNIGERIENFINDSPGDKLNPYLEWEVKVSIECEFEFQRLDYNTSTNTLDTLIEKNWIYQDAFHQIPYTGSWFNYAPPVNGLNYDDAELDTMGGWEESPINPYPFRVRITPPIKGRYKFRIKYDILNGTEYYYSPFYYFDAKSHSNPRLVISDNERFYTRNGKLFMPVGTNIGWPASSYARETKYPGFVSGLHGAPEDFRPPDITTPPRCYTTFRQEITELASNGANYLRWMNTAPTFDIEWDSLGDYSHRMHIAQEIDSCLWLAEDLGIYIHWNLAYHGPFSNNLYGRKGYDFGQTIPDIEYANGNYDSTFYHRDNSFAYSKEFNLTYGYEFFGHQEAQKYYKQKMRYFMARWGYSQSIALFEILSETDQVGYVYDSYDHFDLIWNPYGGESNDAQGATTSTPLPGGLSPSAVRDIMQNFNTEMSAYLKSLLPWEKLGIERCSPYIGLDYVEIKESDNSFSIPTVDVIGTNTYNFGHIPNMNQEAKILPGIAAIDGRANSKMFMFPETGPLELNICDNGTEFLRSVAKRCFIQSGGSLDWESNRYHRDKWSYFGKISDFMNLHSRTDWHPGAYKRRLNGTYKLKKHWLKHTVRKDGLADMCYMRSDDGTEAIGVITNRTLNMFTNRDLAFDLPFDLDNDSTFCYGATVNLINFGGDTLQINNYSVSTKNNQYNGWSIIDNNNRLITDLQSPSEVNASSGKDGLIVRKLTNDYKVITYYKLSDSPVPYAYGFSGSSDVILDYPKLGTTTDDFMVFFHIKPYFAGKANTEKLSDTTKIIEYEVSNDVKIFPNPIMESDEITVNIQNELLSIVSIFDSKATLLKTEKLRFGSNKIDVKDFNSGTYYFLFQNESSTFYITKKIVKL